MSSQTIKDTTLVNDYPWHDSSWEKLATARNKNHLPHALLISGSEGTGRLDFAKKITKSLLCTSPINNLACQQCKSCKTFQAQANPDFLNIELQEEKQQISVDQIRQLSDFISYTRSYNAYRVILLSPVERMNKNAANSLLKSLEEPANNTVIILVANNLSRILPTIKSRCQLLALPSPTKKQAIDWLKQQSPTNNAEELLTMANGQPLTAIKISNDDIQNRVALAEDLLAISTQQKPLTEIAKKWEKSDHSLMLNWQINWLEYFIKNNEISINIVEDPNKDLNNILGSLNKALSPDSLWGLYYSLIAQKQYIHTSVNTLLFLENMLSLWAEANLTK